jgi:hypothetical protein
MLESKGRDAMSLKPGGNLVNSYRIRGSLTCVSPLHVGSGLWEKIEGGATSRSC